MAVLDYQTLMLPVLDMDVPFEIALRQVVPLRTVLGCSHGYDAVGTDRI